MTIMIKTALLVALTDSMRATGDHFNFRGANIYRIRGGLFRVVGHHVGEAQKTIDYLNEKAAKLTIDAYNRPVIGE